MHEANALCSGAREQQNAVPQHPVPQQRRGVIEEHEVDEVAADGARRRANHPEQRVLGCGGAGDTWVVDEDGDIDIAVATLGSAGPAAEQPSEANDRIRAQAARKIGGQALCRFLARGGRVLHPGTTLADGAGWSERVGKVLGVPAPAGPQ